MAVQHHINAHWLRQSSTRRVFSLIADGGFQARIVGGAVRNTLLGLPISDIDFATTALPDDVIALAKTANIKYIPTGLSHGTVSLVIEGDVFELTTLRTDQQTDGRHAVVSFTDDWAADAMRRDFTLNALYVDADGALFDPLGGLSDVSPAKIIFIGKADERIEEDYLRILRFFRFYAQYGAGEIDRAGFDACVRGGRGLAQISGERIHVEMMKMLAAPLALQSVSCLYDGGLFGDIFSAVPRLSRFEAMLDVEQNLELSPNSLLRLGALFVDVIEDVTLLDKRLRLSKQQKQYLTWFAGLGYQDWFDAPKLDKFLYFESSEAVQVSLLRFMLDHFSSADFAEYRSVLAYITFWQTPKFPLKGQDLKDRGFESGVVLGQTLKALQHRWVESRFTLSKEALLASL